MYCGWYGIHSMGGFGWMMLFGILAIGAIVWTLVTVFQKTHRPQASTDGRGDAAMDILNRRYASGEISKEEYETIAREIKR